MTLGALLVRFLLAAVIVIAAGTVLARAGDVIAARTRLGGAWVGSVFLALATSLPEIVTDIAAVRLGAIDLAVGDLMGSSMANMLILALISLAPAGVDMFRRAAFDHALYACLAIIMTILAAIGIMTQANTRVFGMGAWSLVLVSTYLITSSLAFRVSPVAKAAGEVAEMSGRERTESEAPVSHLVPMSLRRAMLFFLGAAAVIVIVAPQFAKAAEGLAVVSGMGHTFMGTWLVGLSTSLPELVTSMAAVRLRAYDLAVGNLFGSNAINMTIFALLDPFHSAPILSVASLDHVVTALVAVVLMTLALGTLVLRTRRTAAREPGSVLVVLGYVASIALVYWQSAAATLTQKRAHATVLISLDGFRADYITRPGAVRLRELAARGVRAERLVPSFPSKTFPNHYTIVTGLYPEHHGIVANTMRDERIGTTFTIGDTIIARDPRWWGGEPIWNTAERQGVRTAAFFWPGSDYAVNGRYPTYYTPYDGRIPNAQRVRQVLDWLVMPAERAPRLITLYFSTTDDAGHKYGPSAPQVDTAIAQVDSLVGALMDGLAQRGLEEHVNVVVVSDHGMTEIDSTRVIRLDEYVNLDDVEVVDWMPVAAVVPKPGALESVYAALKRVPHLQVFRKDSVPPQYHYRAHPRITPLVLLAEEGWTISSTARLRRNGMPRGGTHGYDNFLPSMGALFVAAGPDIQPGRVIGPVANVHVYPLLARLLGIVPAPSDGHADSLPITRRD